MRNFKKFLTLVLAVMMVVSSFAFNASAATTKFEDIDAKNEALVEAVDLLAYMGVAKGTSETTFGADQNVTREQFALFIYRLMNEGKDAPKTSKNSTKFTDLEDPTYFYAIAWAQANGIVTGRTETTFDPKGTITLQEAFTMIVRALDWDEDGELIYPFGFITVAEQNGVELDKNLDSEVGYTDALTRADMAILLYNAFFAETGVEEVETVVAKNGDNYYLKEVTTNPRLCEKKFDVVEVEYNVFATPHYYMSGEAEEATFDYGYDAIYAVKATNSDVNLDAEAQTAPAIYYFTPEQLGVEADELDELFLGRLTTFVTLETKNNEKEIDKVLFADVDITKKNVTEMSLGVVSTNKEESYFKNPDYNAEEEDSEEYFDAKLLSGKIVAGDDVFYAYNAPYSYVEPTYPTQFEEGQDAAEVKYGLRNAKNVKNISFEIDTNVTEDDVTVYVATVADLYAAEDEPATNPWEAAHPFQYEAKALADTFTAVYNDGYYEADLYDVDGDGRVDYIDYKEYMLFQVDSNEDKDFEDSFVSGGAYYTKNDDIPYIYTNEATVIGEDFADEDFVIGYVDKNLETVKVVAVVKPVVDTVANAKKGILTLASGDKVDAVAEGWKLKPTAPVFDADATLKAAVDADAFDVFGAEALDEEQTFYIYDGMLVYVDGIDSNTKFVENLIIPTTLDGRMTVREEYDLEADEAVFYVYAWVDGATKRVPVATEDLLPGVIVWDSEAEKYVLGAEYEDRLCTYTVDSNGIYTITSLGYDVDDDDATEYTGLAKEGATIDEETCDIDVTLGTTQEPGKADAQWYFDTTANATIGKVSGSRFKVLDFDAEEETKLFARDIDLKSYTKIIIRIEDTDETNAKDRYDYKTYDASSFKKALKDDVSLQNLSMIVSNNADSAKRENLVVLYAETTDFAFAGDIDKDGYRIVSENEIRKDDEGMWRAYFKLLNPLTGAEQKDVPTAESFKKATDAQAYADDVALGSMIKLVDGMVDNDDDYEVYATMDTANLVWISEVDTEEGYFKATLVDGFDASQYSDELTNKEKIAEYVEDNASANNIDGRDIDTPYISVDNNTVISVVKYSGAIDASDFWKFASMEATTFEKLAEADKELLCYHDRSFNNKGSYVTTEAEFVKAFVSVDRDEILEVGENRTAEYIIILVHNKDAAAFEDNR